VHSIENASIEQLEQIKLWLFQENIRIENEKEELEKKKKEFAQEKAILKRQISELECRNHIDQQQLTQEKMLFKQKWSILENAYRDLHEERKKVEIEKQQLIRENKYTGRHYSNSMTVSPGFFFKGVDNSLALKKRYKDLIKIFHPDNIAGDNETVQIINSEYGLLKDAYQL